jgi:hypothetical protein
MWKFRENCPNSFVIGCVYVCVCKHTPEIIIIIIIIIIIMVMIKVKVTL